MGMSPNRKISIVFFLLSILWFVLTYATISYEGVTVETALHGLIGVLCLGLFCILRIDNEKDN